MKYIIHSTVIFDTTEYLLTLLNDSNTSVKLSNSAGRILEELIKYQNTHEPITREHLFSNVWRNHGLEPSNGNLNQQISLLRKNFNLFGLDPMSIITIPKRGFKLKHQINIKILEQDPYIHISHVKHQNLYKESFLSNPNILTTNIKYTIVVLIIIITALSISILYLYIKNKNNKKLYLCKEINSCNICTFHQIPNSKCNILKTSILSK